MCGGVGSGYAAQAPDATRLGDRLDSTSKLISGKITPVIGLSAGSAKLVWPSTYMFSSGFSIEHSGHFISVPFKIESSSGPPLTREGYTLARANVPSRFSQMNGSHPPHDIGSRI